MSIETQIRHMSEENMPGAENSEQPLGSVELGQEVSIDSLQARIESIVADVIEDFPKVKTWNDISCSILQIGITSLIEAVGRQNKNDFRNVNLLEARDLYFRADRKINEKTRQVGIIRGMMVETGISPVSAGSNMSEVFRRTLEALKEGKSASVHKNPAKELKITGVQSFSGTSGAQDKLRQIGRSGSKF